MEALGNRDLASLPRRREERRQVEMLAHFTHRAMRSTVMLKDLTCGGARIEGITGLEEDEAVSLSLPGCKPMLAFIAWSHGPCAGLEFAEPIEDARLQVLVIDHARDHTRDHTQSVAMPRRTFAA